MKRLAGLLTAIALLLSLCGCSMRPYDVEYGASASDVSETEVEEDKGPGYPIVHIKGVTLPEEYGDGLLNCEAVYWIVNYLRVNEGLEPLNRGDAAMQKAALLRLEETVSQFSHTRPNGEKFSTAITECGIECTFVNENLACGQYTAEHVVHDWLNSDTHRANLFDPDIESVCIACRPDEYGVPYWVFEGVRYSELQPKPEGYVQPDYEKYVDPDTVLLSRTDAVTE